MISTAALCIRNAAVDVIVVNVSIVLVVAVVVGKKRSL
jgi:hypothetical protein